MTHFRSFAIGRFWKLFQDLPTEIQELAIRKYQIFERDPYHPSLGFQAKGGVCTVDIGRSYRAIALRRENDLSWFWIGSHEDYNNVLARVK